MRSAAALIGSHPVAATRVEILVNGVEIFPAMLEAIRSARSTINLATYVYWRGEIAREVADAIVERRRKGVECRVLLDAVGAARMSDELKQAMREAGVEVVMFRPPGRMELGRANHRNHRKLLIVDGKIAMTGGVGIAQEWTGDAQDPDHWRDTHAVIEGPVVASLQGAFAENWLEATNELLVGERFVPASSREDETMSTLLVRSSAGVGSTNVEAVYALAIAAAETRIELTAGYFSPNRAFVQALADAAQRGVDVRILVPGPHINHDVVREAGQHAYEELLAAGVRLFEYTPTLLHAKTLVIDRSLSSIGSVNFDNRSFCLNDEATLIVQSQSCAERLGRVFEHDLSRSSEIELERWRDRPARHKLKELALQPFKPGL